MQDLRTYINEAISSRANSVGISSYTPFPQKRTDKDGIVEWLVDNGFKSIEFFGTYIGDDLIKHYDSTGERCFYVSAHNSSPGTHYIIFYDGTKMFLIYTCRMDIIRHGIEPVSYINKPTIGNCKFERNFKYCSLREIQRYFNS